jgi:uncharacterized membrane protein YccC
MQRYLRYAAAGIQFAVVMTLFTLGGAWLDSKVERLRPLFTILGALLGMAGAATALVFQVFGPKKP